MMKMIRPLFLLAISTAAVSSPSHAQTGVQAYRYCSLDHSGATVCYFNDRVACAKAGSGRCFDNPYYSSAYAAAPEQRRSDRMRRP